VPTEVSKHSAKVSERFRRYCEVEGRNAVIEQVAYSSGAIPISHMLNAGGTSGLVTLPINQPLMLVRLKHVVGVPSAVEGQGLSISKLQILDALIEQLVRVKGAGTDVEALKKPDSKGIDAAINSAKSQLDAEIAHSAETSYGAALVGMDGAQLLNVSV
jgi:hypothetical protein